MGEVLLKKLNKIKPQQKLGENGILKGSQAQ